MQFFLEHRILAITFGIVLIVVVFAVSQVVYVMHNGASVAAPSIPRESLVFGDPKNEPLSLVVMGDSTSIGQGATYESSISVQSAVFLAQDHYVSLINTGISGATTSEVRDLQLNKAIESAPDRVLIAVGANDVTKFSSYTNVNIAMRDIIRALRQANPEVSIVLTGSPQVGSVARFTKPLQYLARQRVSKINKIYDTITRDLNVTRVPLAEQTGEIFLRDKSLFATDKFHPNAEGYAVWQPIINKAL